MEIYCKLLTLPLKKKYDVDVFSRDQFLHCKLPKYFAYVINLSPIHEQGSHWVALMGDHKSAKFFCSYGIPFEEYGKDFKEFAMKYGLSVSSNTRRFQSLSSDFCGEFCITFISYNNRNEDLCRIFSTNVNENDLYALEFVKSLGSCLTPEMKSICNQISLKYNKYRTR